MELDGWDPLSEHYYDQNSNSYNSGAGARMPSHMQPATYRKSDDNPFVLWLRPLDSRYTEESLRNIFSNYGVVTDVKIVYPKNDSKNNSPFGYVTYKTQAAATAAIRGFNDSDKFDFKVQYAKEGANFRKDGRNTRSNQSNYSRNFNDSRNTPNSSTSTSTNERQNSSTMVNEPVNDFSSKPPRTNVDQDINNYRPRDNAQSRPRLSSLASSGSTPTSAVVTRNVPEEMKARSFTIKKEPEDKSAKTSYIKPMQCCHCQKMTFSICKECRNSFCHAECSLDGWRSHTTPECIHLAELIKIDSAHTAASRNTSVSSDRNVSFTDDLTRKYASDYSSPTTEYTDFQILANDYIENGNKSMEDALPKPPKFDAVCDNNYEENMLQEDTVFNTQSERVPQPQPYQPRGPRQYGSDHERGTGRNYRPRDNNEGANDQGRGYRSRNDRESGASDQDRNSGGRNYRQRDDRESGASDYDRNSGGGRGGFNRDRDRRQPEGGSDLERGGGRNFQRDSNRDRDGRSGFDRKKNYNDRGNRRQSDEVDNAGSFESGGTKPSRGSYQNDRNDFDSRVDFDSEAKSRGGGYQKRNNAQNRIDNMSSNVEADRNTSGEFSSKANSSLNENRDRDSRRHSNRQTEQKRFELNQTLQITIVSIDRTGRCSVRLAENEGIFQDIMKSCREMALEQLENCAVGAKCVAMYKTEWHRGLIRNEQPLRVYFIDVGVECEVDRQHVRVAPAQLLTYGPFAWRVLLPNVSGDELFKWQNENKIVSIKATSFVEKDRYYVADVISFEEQIAEARKESDAGSQRPSAPTSTTSVPPPSTPAPTPVVVPEQKVVAVQGPELRSNQLVEVFVSYIVNEKEFFVAFVQSVVKLAEQVSNEDINSLSPLLEIQTGCLAMTEYCGDWCRVKIVSTDPLKVSFIDYGNVETCEAKKLKVLPTELAKTPPLATRVKLHTGTVADNEVAENTLVKVTPIVKENDAWLVLVGDKSGECASILQQMESLTVTPAPAPSRSEPAQPKPKVALAMLITYAESKSLVYGIHKKDGAALEAVNAKLVEPFEPAGTLVLNKLYVKQFDGFWCRARLISVDPVEIYFVDYGNAEKCSKEELFELPEDIRSQPPLAIKMVLEKESGGVLEYGAFVEVSWDMEKDTYLLTRDPTNPESSDAATSTKVVNVVSALGDSSYAVILEENRNAYKYINREINANVDRLRKPKKIDINGLCLAIYEDECWHRAKIIKKSPLSVSFLDFANEMACEFHQLKEMPVGMAEIPPLAFKIKTEDYVELEEGCAVKITKIEELDYNYWKVATIKEKDRKGPHKHVEIISDPKHISTVTKKQAKSSTSRGTVTSTPISKDINDIIVIDDGDDDNAGQAKTSTNRSAARAISKDIIVIDDDDDDKDSAMTRSQQENETRAKKDIAKTNKTVKSKGKSGKNQAKRYDENCLLFTRLSHVPKNYVNTLTSGVENLKMIEPLRNSTFYDINVPISEHLLDILRCGDHCILIVHDSLCDDEYTGMLLCKRLGPSVDVLDQIENTAENAESFSAKKGDLVVTFVDGINNWHRGYVVYEPSNVDPFYLLILFDVGILYKTDLVYRLDDEYRHVPQLAVRINVTYFQPVPDDIARLEVVPKNVKMNEGDTYQHDKSIYRVELTKTMEDGFEGKLMSQFRRDNVSHTISLTRWRPTREEIGVKHVPVMTGDLVKIGSICETNQCYVIPVDDAINEQRLDFLSTVALNCKNAKSIEGELKLKEIVGVPYLKSYYRAQIIERKRNSYVVRILDIGIEIKIFKTDIKRLPDNLKFADCYAVGVQLHNVPSTDFNQFSETFLKHVVTHESHFTLEINESTRLIELIFNDEIEKFDIKKGSSFNYRLDKLLIPLWKVQDLDFDAKFFLMQLKFEEWPIGSELSLYFVECLDETCGIMINRYGETYAKIIRVNLNERLKEYAEENNQSYVPVKEELCVGKFDDNNWYRAVCVEVEPGKDLHLQFIDIGFRRTVPHTSIRRMHADFLKHPAAALFCNVVNYMDCRSLPELQGRVLKKCRVVRKIEEGGYDIYVAHLNAYSAKENDVADA